VVSSGRPAGSSQRRGTNHLGGSRRAAHYPDAPYILVACRPGPTLGVEIYDSKPFLAVSGQISGMFSHLRAAIRTSHCPLYSGPGKRSGPFRTPAFGASTFMDDWPVNGVWPYTQHGAWNRARETVAMALLVPF
jgi:hypothetical protein